MSGQFWPDALVDSIARRDFVVFVGSGISAASVNNAGDSPPTWSDLLGSLADLLSTGSARERVTSRVRRDLLDAAEVLVSEARESSRLTDVRQRIVGLVDGPVDDRFSPNPWHDQIMRLDPRVILTTNYDRIIERAHGFSVARPEDSHLGRDIRLGNPTIIHLHGTVEVEEGLVLSHSDYARLRRECHHMLDVVRSLLMTRTCLFLGYSLADPDIRLLLEAVARPESGEVAHYMLAPSGTVKDRHLKSLFERSFGVGCLGYPGPGHDQGFARLTDLADSVELRRSA